jgi:hypothetical protein
VEARRVVLIIVAVAVCAGLGLWLGATVADDTGSIAVITAACGVIGSFAPATVRWVSGASRGQLGGRGRPS